MIEPTLLVAFAAGALSFLAPCVIPLLPLYLGYISASSSQKPSLSGPLLYVFGFSTVFVILGLGASALGRALIANQGTFLRLGGVLIIFLGISSLGFLDRIDFFQRTFAIQISERLRQVHFLGPLLLGVTFGFAWTPCIGPILGAILTMAASSQALQQGALLLFAYSLGISLPFLIFALTFNRSRKFLKQILPSLWVTKYLSGAILIGLGIIMVTGYFRTFSSYFAVKLYRVDLYRWLMNYF